MSSPNLSDYPSWMSNDEAKTALSCDDVGLEAYISSGDLMPLSWQGDPAIRCFDRTQVTILAAGS